MLMRFAFVVALLVAGLTIVCGGDEKAPLPFEPEPTSTATLAPAPTEEPTLAPTATATNPPAPTATPTTAPRVAQPTATRAPARPPNSGQWIDVNVSSYTVRLMDGQAAVKTLGPVGVGREIDTGVWESTATGLFYVYSMDAALVYDAPYDTYISHWVGFDPSLANGFHSFLKDKDGKVVDPSTGNVSNGCIRVGDVEAVFNYAHIGMPVFVHS